MIDTLSLYSSLFIFLFPYAGKLWFSRSTLATTVVSLGVLGTFGGIFIGLLNFDVDHIDVALPQLLNGLKTAFLTSIAGMCSSLLLKLWPAFYLMKAEKETEDVSQVDQMIAILSGIEKNIATANQQSGEGLAKLNESFSSFTENMSQLNADAMTTALGEVVKTWDSKLTGEMNKAIQEINTAVQQIEKTQVGNAGDIRALATDLKATLEMIQQSTGNLGQYLNKSVNISSRQQEAMTSQMGNLGILMKTTEEHFEQQISDMEERFKRELSAMEQFTRTLVTIVKKLSQDHTAINRIKDEEDI